MVRLSVADVVDFFNKVKEATDDVSDTKLIEKIKDLINRKPNHLKAWDYLARNCFHYLQSVELAEFIYKKDPSLINQRDNNGWLPIHCAAYDGRLPIVKFIVEKEHTQLHATVTYTSEKSPLLLACIKPKSNIIEWILTRDPSTLNHVDNAGNTALHWVADYWDHIPQSALECAKLLLKGNSEMRWVRNYYGLTPVVIARSTHGNSGLTLYLERLAKHDETIADAKSFLKVLKVMIRAMEEDEPAMIMTRATQTKKTKIDAFGVVAAWTNSIAMNAKSEIKNLIQS